MKEDELEIIKTKEHYISLAESVMKGRNDSSIPDFYYSYVAFEIVYNSNLNDAGEFAENFDYFERFHIDKFYSIDSKKLFDIEKRELIREKLVELITKKELDIPISYCTYVTRKFAYMIDFNNDEHTSKSLESYANLLIDEYNKKFKVKTLFTGNPVVKIKNRIMQFRKADK